MLGRLAILSLSCGFGVLPILAQEAPAPGQSRLQGRVLHAEGKRPAAGAIVTAVHLDSGRAFPAEAASNGGSYELDGLPYGYYSMAVDAGGTLFAVTRPVNLPPSYRLTLDIALSDVSQPTEGAEGLEEGVLVPVLNRRALARATPIGDEKAPFLKSKLGYILGAGGALVLFLLLQ